MSLERKPATRPAQDAAARTLKPSVNPALRLQELLRRESQQAREASLPAPPVEDAASAVLPPPLALITPDSLPETPPAPPLAPTEDRATENQEPATLIVLVNSERSTPVEYPSVAEMPTAEDLQGKYDAFLLSDEWHRRGTALIRTVRLRRRRR